MEGAELTATNPTGELTEGEIIKSLLRARVNFTKISNKDSKSPQVMPLTEMCSSSQQFAQ